eukprot:3743010-Pleurochrysis_carterae.AAC.1
MAHAVGRAGRAYRRRALNAPIDAEIEQALKYDEMERLAEFRLRVVRTRIASVRTWRQRASRLGVGRKLEEEKVVE